MLNINSISVNVTKNLSVDCGHTTEEEEECVGREKGVKNKNQNENQKRKKSTRHK